MVAMVLRKVHKVIVGTDIVIDTKFLAPIAVKILFFDPFSGDKKRL